MNKNLLEYEIKQKGLTISDFCKKLGINRSTYYRKTNGISEFTQSEIASTIEFLDLKSPIDIFFDTKVS